MKKMIVQKSEVVKCSFFSYVIDGKVEVFPTSISYKGCGTQFLDEAPT